MQALDSDFSDLLLRYVVTDRLMLGAIGGLVDPQDFEDKSERIIASLAVSYWREYEEPISSFLRIEVTDYISRRKTPMRDDAKSALLKKVNSILKRERPLMAPARVHKMFREFKTEQFMRRSMDEVLELQLSGQLNIGKFGEIARKVSEFTDSTEFESRDYTETLDERVKQRIARGTVRQPLFFIDPLDERIRNLRRKELGLFLAPFKSGKSMALSHMAVAHARQKDNVLHVSFEDTKETLEDRLDAQIADLPINQVADLSNELQDRFAAAVKRFRRRIQLVDAVGKEMTIAQVDTICERLRSKGFVVDTLVLDYDDKITPPKFYPDSKRREIDETYNEILNLAGRREMRVWSAAQVNRSGDGRKIVDGKLVAEDIRKVQKTVIAIGIGVGDQGGMNKHLYVAAHRDGDSRFGVDVIANYKHGQFYDREETMRQFGKAAKGKVDLDA